MSPFCNRRLFESRAATARGAALRLRRGYTLVEMVAVMASSTVLVGGLASTVLISSRALQRDTSPGTDANRSGAALAQMTGDLRQALRFTERTATAMTFLVPDRTGDSVADTIRYSWSGTVGHPLMYQFNAEPALAIAEDVRQFNLNAITRSIVAESVVPPPAPVVFEMFTEGKMAANTTSLTVAAPAGTSAGRLLIAAVAVDGTAGPSLVAPAGWNLISAVNGGGQVGMGVWWKIATATEPANHTFNWTGNQQAYGWIMRFAGADSVNPIHAFSTATGTSSTPQCPSVTTTEGYTMILRLGGFDSNRINVNNAGMAQHTTITVDQSSADSSNAASGGAAYKTLAPETSSGTSTFALTSSEEYVTFTVAIAPVPAW